MITPGSRYKQRHGKDGKRRHEAAAGFTYHAEGGCYECPRGKKPAYKRTGTPGSGGGKEYQAGVPDCRLCADFGKCIKGKKEQGKITKGRGLFIGVSSAEGGCCAGMRERLNTVEYQDLYTRRIQIIEPVFADITECKGMDRFTLRGKDKVNGQRLLYCMVHNTGKCLKEYNRRTDYA